MLMGSIMAQDFQMQVAEMYRKYEVLIEKVQKYDVLMVDVANLNAKVEDYQNALSGVMMGINDKFKDIADLIAATNESIHALDNKIDMNKVEFSEYTRKNSQVLVDMDANHKAVHHFVEKTHGRLSEHANNAASKDDLQNLKRIHDNDAGSLAVGMKAIDAKLNAMRIDFESNVSIVKYFQEKAKSYDEDILNISSAMEKQKASLESSIKAISQAIPLQMENYSKPLMVRFSEIEQLIAAIPSTKELKDELDRKIELLSMDCRNAALKIENQEQKIKFMEKQLENTNLRVGKVELKQ